MVNKSSDINIEFDDYIKTFDMWEKMGVDNEVNIRNQIVFKAFSIAINKTVNDINWILWDLNWREDKIIPMQVAYKISKELNNNSISNVEERIKSSLWITLWYDEMWNYWYNNKNAA